MNTQHLRIALRYLKGKKSHQAVNVIAWVSVAAVAVAAMAMVVVLSVFNGFNRLATSRLSLLDPPGLVTSNNSAVVAQADKVARRLEQLPQIAAARPVVQGEALANYGDQQLPVKLKGVPVDYHATNRIDEAVIDGVRIEEGAYVTLGAGVAIAFDARPAYDRPMFVSAPRRTGRINPALPIGAFVIDTLRVSGVFSTQQADADAQTIYLPLDRARRLLEYRDGQATAIEIAPATGVSEQEMLRAAREELGAGYSVASRLEQEETGLRMINVEKWITFILLLFVVVMASFNLLSTMTMLVIEKRDSIGIFRSLGATAAFIRSIFFSEGFIISLAGGALGIIVGIALCLLQQSTGFIEMGGDHSQMSITAYPVALKLADVAVVAGVITVVGLIGGLISRPKVQ